MREKERRGLLVRKETGEGSERKLEERRAKERGREVRVEKHEWGYW